MKVSVVVAEAWRSLTASLSTTLAAAMTVLIGMFLVGLLIALGTWARLVEQTARRSKLVDRRSSSAPRPSAAARSTPAQIERGAHPDSCNDPRVEERRIHLEGRRPSRSCRERAPRWPGA